LCHAEKCGGPGGSLDFFWTFGFSASAQRRGQHGIAVNCFFLGAKMANGTSDGAASDSSGAAVPPATASPDKTAAEPPQPTASQGGNAVPPAPPAANGGALPPDPPIGDVTVFVSEVIRNEVRDALELADFIVKSGVRQANGGSLAPEILSVIKVTAGKIRLFEKPSDPIHILASEWTRFELSYYALVEFSSPVTVETLRNTRNTGQFNFLQASSAQKFTWLLWFFTLLFTAIVITCGIIATGADNATSRAPANLFRTLNNYIPIIVPWVYGGLGACAYLLRTAHSLIAERSFDVRRKPEYLNRILLGMVSGGAIVLLFNPSGDDDTVKISAAALGFVAGYSNDLLFSAVERVVAAILPKVSLDTVKKDSVAARPPLELPPGGATLTDLMDRMEKAAPEDKDLYRSLIAKLRDRL
jgi:hypothetical protein